MCVLYSVHTFNVHYYFEQNVNCLQSYSLPRLGSLGLIKGIQFIKRIASKTKWIEGCHNGPDSLCIIQRSCINASRRQYSFSVSWSGNCSIPTVLHCITPNILKNMSSPALLCYPPSRGRLQNKAGDEKILRAILFSILFFIRASSTFLLIRALVKDIT